ncbi:hypothetical protein SAMN05421762_3291 [Pseudooceanicola nitratireducens]|jgi:hypothetical protein|uniref:Uncharacterized protein n=1 Tax=Pseudooceanicola nitratireducens TaxID=517719 RepID=A0A1I1P262_9RHOB|nr:hypothetical protein SAMN05216183_10144 [Pseudooceanicola nitratireducens]SFD03907.1 hypothetical protein SAMN05421762_3291 [Pseudooceanicola nitratireducens]
MLDHSKISSTEFPPLERHLPRDFPGLDLNFCRNPTCASFGMHPDPFKRTTDSDPAPGSVLRGTVSGAMHEEYFKCPTCNKTSRLRKNRAIPEGYRRLKYLPEHDPTAPSCRSEGCFAHGMSGEANQGFYWRFGKTAKGDPRYKCRL